MTPLGERLAERIRREGPIRVEDYMEACVADYYASRDPFGRAGDFTTAPEISQMFGELIGLWTVDLVVRAGAPAFDLVELGPGRGTLMADMLRALRSTGTSVAGIHLVETSPALRRRQAELVPDAVWHDDLGSLPVGRPLIVVANEFFDALPIRQDVYVNGAWQERRVTFSNGHFAFTPEGARIRESSPVHSDVMTSLARRIAAQGGAALVIDYGYAAAAEGDTLQALSHHRAADPLAAPGEADLTAHVDFAALADAAKGTRVSPLTTQGAFLTALGIDIRAERLARGLDAEARHAVASAMRRLIAPQAMGGLFKVLAIRHPEWPLPAGFAA